LSGRSDYYAVARYSAASNIKKQLTNYQMIESRIY
jgi:hypothetical protein